jgi:hypothetical protein
MRRATKIASPASRVSYCCFLVGLADAVFFHLRQLHGSSGTNISEPKLDKVRTTDHIRLATVLAKATQNGESAESRCWLRLR